MSVSTIHYHTHSYAEPHTYLLTLLCTERRPLLGRISDSEHQAQVEPTAAGCAVRAVVGSLPQQWPQVRVVHLCLMPSYLHLMLSVLSPMPEGCTFGTLLQALRADCCQAAAPHLPSAVPCLLDDEYFDQVVDAPDAQAAALRLMLYTPQQLLVRQQHADLFCRHSNVHLGGLPMDAMGNFDLLRHLLLAVHCRHDWSADDTADYTAHCLEAAAAGAVLVGAFVSPAERALLSAATAANRPTIRLLYYGLPKADEIEAADADSLASGRLLLLSPFPPSDPSQPLRRAQCALLNEVAEHLAEANIWQQ